MISSPLPDHHRCEQSNNNGDGDGGDGRAGQACDDGHSGCLIEVGPTRPCSARSDGTNRKNAPQTSPTIGRATAQYPSREVRAWTQNSGDTLSRIRSLRAGIKPMHSITYTTARRLNLRPRRWLSRPYPVVLAVSRVGMIRSSRNPDPSAPPNLTSCHSDNSLPNNTSRRGRRTSACPQPGTLSRASRPTR